MTDFLEIFANEFLLLNELDVAQGLGSKFDGLVKPVLSSVGNVNNLDDLGLQTLIEHVGLVQVVLEVGRTSQDQTRNVDLVVGKEVLSSQLGDLSNVVVTLFLTKTGETKRRLTTTAVLLGQVDAQFLENFSGVSAEGTKERAVTVHDDETEPLIRLKELTQGFCVELVVTEIERRVDGLERLEVDVNLPFLSFGGDNFTTVYDQAIRRDLVVELETLLCGCNGREDGKSVDTGFDVGSSTLSTKLATVFFTFNAP